MVTAVIRGLLNYQTQPLPRDLLLELPKMKRGQRIVAIRKARGLNQQKDLRKKAKLASATCATIETRDTIPSPKHLFNIAAALQIDPLLITFGQSWEEMSCKLTDGEKMHFLRLRRGWTQKDLAIELEKAGLVFDTKDLNAKRTCIAQWERGAATPTPEKRSIIRRVLDDETLFRTTAVLAPKPIIPKPVIPKPAVPAKLIAAPPKPETKSQPPSEPEPSYQKFIDAKSYEALSALENLETIPLAGKTNIDTLPWVLRIRTLIKELRQLKAEEEAGVIETDLEKKLTDLRQKITETQRAQTQIQPQPKQPQMQPTPGFQISPEARKTANRTISGLLKDFPGKSIIQILPILARHQDWNAVRVAIERVETNQAKKLTPPDRAYLQEVKSQIPPMK